MSDAPPQPFAVQTERVADATILRATGELDLGSVEQLRAALGAATRPPQIVILDLTGLTFIDSMGLRELLSEHRNATAAGYEFVITGASGPVRDLLRITALDITLPLAPDIEAVLAR